MDPEKQFSGLNSAEFRDIFAKINKFDPEAEDEAMENVDKLLQEVGVGNKNKKFLEDYLHRCLTSNLKSSANYINSKKLWAASIDKEFTQRQHEAILAAHYLRLKDYYGDLDNKTLRKLKRNQNSTINLNIIRESYNGNERRAKKRREWINENLYGGLDDINSKNRRVGFEIEEETQKINGFVKNAKDTVKEIINEKNFEPEAFFNHLMDMKHKKLMDRGYAQRDPQIFTEEMKQDYPGIEEKFNDMKPKKLKMWTFEGELDKAGLRQALEFSNQVSFKAILTTNNTRLA
jgi:hypothetical protein